MKIGIFTDGYLPQLNGVAVSVKNSEDALRKRGHEVYVVAAKYPKLEKESKYIIRLNSIPIIKEWNLRMGTHLPEKALFDISRIKFDIIHGHSGGPISFLGFEYAKFKRIPYVFTYHTLFRKYTHYFLGGKVLKPKMTELASKLFCNYCDYIVAPTESIKNELLSYGVTKPIAVIPSGIDIEKFNVKEKGFLKAKLGISEEQKILLYVGRFAKEKSVDFLINAFKFIAEKNENAVLVLVGVGSAKEEKSLKSLITKLNLGKKVYFTGAVSQADIAKAYADGYVFVFASESETQGMIMPESLASGLPVVVVKDEAFEGVIIDGENGLVASRDYQDFAEKTLTLLNNQTLREEMSKKAKLSAKKYSIEKNAERLEMLYLSLV